MRSRLHFNLAVLGMLQAKADSTSDDLMYVLTRSTVCVCMIRTQTKPRECALPMTMLGAS